MIFEKFKQIGVLASQRKARKLGLKKIKSQPDELILMMPLSPQESEYNILVDDKAQDYPGAKGLAYRNEFDAVGMAVGVVPVKVVNGELMWGATAPSYFADPAVFTEIAGTANLSESEAIQGIYWGDYSIQTNEGIRIDKQSLISFMHTQQTQTSATTKAMIDGSEVKSLGAVVTFSGGDDNYIRIKIQCKDKTHIAGNADHQNFLCVRLIGAETKGGTTARIQNR